MAITGVHAVLYTSEPEAVRTILSEVFGWRHVDAGHGWLIFALPPAELGVHPTEGQGFETTARSEITLMCDDLDATIADLRGRGVEIRGEPVAAGFGMTVTIILPGSLDLMLYQPRHPTAI